MGKSSLNAVIVGLVVFGTLVTGSIAVAGGELATSLLFFFLSAIIVLQVIPGLVLLVALLCELLRRPAAGSGKGRSRS